MYTVAISATRFTCPVSGLVTRRGEIFIQDESGRRLHVSQMPARRLRPLHSTYMGATTPSVSGADISPQGGRKSASAQLLKSQL